MAVVRAALNVLAWTFIFFCACLLMLAMYCCMTDFWINDFLAVFDLTFSRDDLTSGFLFPNALIGTFFTKVIIFVWVPYLAIALMAIWMRQRPFRKVHGEEVGAFDASELAEQQRPSLYKRTADQIKLFFSYQLPPRRLWAFLLDGGFNVTDLVVFSLWASINAIWIYTSFELVWPGYLAVYKETGEWSNGSRRADILYGLGYAGAWAAVYNLVFLFMPIPRNNFLQYLFNCDFAVLIKYHRWLGHGTLWITLFHGIAYYAQWLCTSNAMFRHETFLWQWSGPINNLAGSISFFPFGLMLWITTIPWIRRHFFKLFWTFHITGFLGFMIMLEIHYPSSIWYLPGLVLYFLDVTFRLTQWGVTSGVQCQFVSADKTFVTIRLKYNKSAKVQSSQFLFLNVPSIAGWEWHPISIAGVSPSADGVSQDVILHLKAYGSWTKTLIKQLAEHGTIPVRADGPYGPTHKPEWVSYDTIIMIAGGIGVTPLLGMLREMQAQQNEQHAAKHKGMNGNGHTNGTGNGHVNGAANGFQKSSGTPSYRLPSQVHLIWAVRNRDELQLLDQDLLATAGLPQSWLKLHLFNTQEADDYTSPAKAQDPSLDEALDDYTHSKGPAPPITRQLQPYGFGDFHWALTHVLAFAGAFFCCLLVSAYVSEGAVTGLKGKPVWGVGLLMSLAFIVGSMGLPALIIYPLHILRYRSHLRKCQLAYQRTPPVTEKPTYNKVETEGQEQGISGDQVQRLMPTGRAKSGALDLESGKAASVSFGRPNFSQMIASTISENPPHSRAVVIASGPPSLVVDARLATHDASKVAAQNGLKGIPELAFSNHSFTL